MSRLLITFAFAVGSLTAASLSSADVEAKADLETKTKPWDVGVSDEVRAKANALFARANEKFFADNHAEALELYLEVLAIWQHPHVNLNAAASYIELDRLLDASTHIEQIRKYRKHLGRDDRQKYDAMVVVVESNTAVVSVKSSQKGAVISIDGEQVMVGPGTAKERVMPGKHAVVTSRDGLESESRQIDVRAGETIEVAPVLFVVASEWRWAKWKPWALAGVGAAVAISGAPLLLSARAKREERADFQDEFCQEPEPCRDGTDNAEKIKDYDRSADRRTILANAAFVTGGVVIATGLALALLNRPTQKKREAKDGEVQANVWIGEELLGAQVSMRF